MTTSRFASAERKMTSGTERKLPPLRTLATGDVALGTELVRALGHRLAPDEVFDVWGDEPARVAELVLARPPAKRRRLVRWWSIEDARPGPEVLMALRSLRSIRGTWVVATAATTPHQAWADAGIWDWEVALRLSPAERLAWVQRLLGGAPRNVAGQVLTRVGTSPAHLVAAGRALRLVVDSQPTTGDVSALVPADAGRDFVDALLAGDRRGAMAAAPLVPDPYQALQRLHWLLLDLWTLAELRPAAASRPAREVAEVTGLPRWTLDELIPLAARYPRAKVGDRMEALAVAHVGLRQAPDLAGQVLTTLAAMWLSGR